jgi:hypothetical protein
VLEATIFGQSLYALVEADYSLAELGLDQRGVQVHPAEATLEDVFVTLSRAQNNNGA